MNSIKRFVVYYDSNMDICNWLFFICCIVITLPILAIFQPVTRPAIGVIFLMAGVLILGFGTIMLIQFLWRKIVKWAKTP